jgi:hypothetical protein
VILGCLLAIAVGLAPTLKQRIDSWRGSPAAVPGESRWGESGVAQQPVDPLAGGVFASAGERSTGQASRRLDQTGVIRDELADRERRIAAREEVLWRQVITQFWKRQAAASAATIGLTLIIVLIIAGRMAHWSGFAKRLQEEENRMRNLQLSVIGALEEFESEVTAARAWAATELRSERSAAATQPPMRESFTDSKTPESPILEGAGSIGGGGGERGAAEAAVYREAAQSSVWQRATQALAADRLPQSQATGRSSGAPAHQAAPDDWVRRFLEPDPEMAASVEVTPPSAAVEGPWQEPARRQTPPPRAPEPPPDQDGPGLRERVEFLAAEGFTEREIARRLKLSREEVQLALKLAGGARRASRIGAGDQGARPSGPGPTTEWAPAEWHADESGQ